MVLQHSTRPGFRSSYSEAGPQEFRKDIQNAVHLALPSDIAPFSAITVMTMIWETTYESNENDARSDYNAFKNLTVDRFQFRIEEFKLSFSGPNLRRKLMEKCMSLLPKLGELLIRYYIGRAAYNDVGRRTYLRSAFPR